MGREELSYLSKDRLSDGALKSANELAIVNICFNGRTNIAGSEVVYRSDGKEIMLRDEKDHGRFIAVEKGDSKDTADMFFIRDCKNIKRALVDGRDLKEFLIDGMERRFY